MKSKKRFCLCFSIFSQEKIRKLSRKINENLYEGKLVTGNRLFIVHSVHLLEVPIGGKKFQRFNSNNDDHSS